jgi:hypothetical protein
MAKKQPDLADAIRQLSNRPTPLPPTGKTSPASARKDRQGLRTIAGHFPQEVSKAVKQLALDRDLTVQLLLAEAINDLFRKHKLPPLC